MKLRRKADGFTLIEVLVAVVVLALALTGIIAAGSTFAQQTANQREKTVALWVAHNRIAELQISPGWPSVGTSNGDVEMAGTKWRWLQTVADTADENLRRVDIRIVKQDKPTDKYAYATLTTFLANTGRKGAQ
jgi:general secretion pathway protein I